MLILSTGIRGGGGGLMEGSGLVHLLNKFISEIRSKHVVMFLYTWTMGREGKERGGVQLTIRPIFLVGQTQPYES